MDIAVLLPFIGIIAFATYTQTVTGFALGMIVMGGVTIFELMPIEFTSVVISIVALMNGFCSVKGNFNALNKKTVGLICLTLFPTVYLGLYILEFLSRDFRNILEALLGLAIVIAGIMLTLKPQPLNKPSSNVAFLTAGGAAGLLGGMFTMSGVPLVHLYYRQPFELKTIRLCLISIFFLSSFARITFVGIKGELTLDMLTFSLICLPVVALFTWIGKRYPPPLSSLNMRRLAFVLLVVIGSSLCLKSLYF